MKLEKLQNRLKGLTNAITRFPLTLFFLVAATITNAIDINRTNPDYLKYTLAFLVGSMLSMVAQVIFERFYVESRSRLILLAAACLLTLFYYLIIQSISELTLELSVRTSVMAFALMIAFIWVPVIKSRISFNESFMITFKAFFISLFFSLVLFAGFDAILFAIDQLLFSFTEKAYLHTANIIFQIFAPLYYLSLIPVFSKEGDDDNVKKMSECPKYLEILVSYIVIPLAALFTIILLIYLLRNIGGKFWSNNLLEPMIVSYSITVIIIYILASELTNNLSIAFRSVFPKVLVPIVLFQTISSILKTGDVGITFSRYYVILYGIFSIIAGIIFCLVPVKKNGIIAALLIVFSVISILPPVDAFTISRNNQVSLLEDTLTKNKMLKDNKVTPNASISDSDKKKIINTVDYLNMMEYSKSIPYLMADNEYVDFYETFGFQAYDVPSETPQFVNLGLDQEKGINISGYDYMMTTYFYQSGEESVQEEILKFEKKNQNYTLVRNISKDQTKLSLKNEKGEEILGFPLQEVFEKFQHYSSNKGLITPEEATFRKENDKAALAIIIQNLNMDRTEKTLDYGTDAYVMVKIK